MSVEENFDIRRKSVWYIVFISHVSYNLNKSGWIKQLKGWGGSCTIKISIIDGILICYKSCILCPGNGTFVLENYIFLAVGTMLNPSHSFPLKYIAM